MSNLRAGFLARLEKNDFLGRKEENKFSQP
jgi:hypothetical protein